MSLKEALIQVHSILAAASAPHAIITKNCENNPEQESKSAKILDAEAYFRFLEEYWALFSGKKKPREPIIMTNRKF